MWKRIIRWARRRRVYYIPMVGGVFPVECIGHRPMVLTDRAVAQLAQHVRETTRAR
jgi:hypothetical protein